ncbi:hypothetical protein GCM10027300_13220 [Modestobacter lapidis]
MALYEAYNRHDAGAAAALYAPDGAHEDVAVGRPTQGRDAVAAGLRRFFAAFPDAQWTATDVLEQGGLAFGRYVLTGTLQTDMGPFRAVGQRLELRGVHVLDTADGFIERSQDYWDSGTFRRQMDTTPTREAETAA